MHFVYEIHFIFNVLRLRVPNAFLLLLILYLLAPASSEDLLKLSALDESSSVSVSTSPRPDSRKQHFWRQVSLNFYWKQSIKGIWKKYISSLFTKYVLSLWRSSHDWLGCQFVLTEAPSHFLFNTHALYRGWFVVKPSSLIIFQWVWLIVERFINFGAMFDLHHSSYVVHNDAHFGIWLRHEFPSKNQI